MEKKVYSFLQQARVFAIIMLIANGLAFISPIPMPRFSNWHGVIVHWFMYKSC